jgi:opacity protein-like surface antigen
MRRLLLTLTLAVASVALANPAEAQLPIKFGAQAGYLTGLEDIAAGIPNPADGTFGLGVRAALQPPVLPIGLVAQGLYYFPDGDVNYMTYSLAAQLRLPLPVISPYAIAGWQFRRASGGGGASNTESGAMIGAGVQLNLGLSLFLEGTMEFNEAPSSTIDADNSIVIKGGIMLG